MNIDLYLQVREKEGRLYSDDIVARLPSISPEHPLATEWRARAASASRLNQHLSRQSSPLTILDLGCGNGWLSNLLAKSGHYVLGMDQNHRELKQATRVFSPEKRLSFIEANIFSAPFVSKTFDAILLASVIQYFHQLPPLLNVLLQHLKPEGKIHILDSPLYSEAELEDAVRRSQQYYSKLGVPDMANQYFHHRISELNGYDAKWLYRPQQFKSRLNRLWGQSDSPFPWVVIEKNKGAFVSGRISQPRQNKVIAEAFSGEAEFYDFGAVNNPVMARLRANVRNIVAKQVPPGSSILEINAGTGADALWLVERGYRVHATDIADGMLAAIGRKIESSNHGGQFTVQKLSFTNLEEADHAPFDGVFSNFGGLNCVPDLSVVARGVKKILKPGGWLVWVFMPPVCPWELIQIFRGRAHIATRRLKRGGTRANVRGIEIMTYYFTAKEVSKALGSDFEITGLRSLSLFCPPMNLLGFINRFPRLTRFLMRLDERAGALPLLNQCGDFLVLTARYSPRP